MESSSSSMEIDTLASSEMTNTMELASGLAPKIRLKGKVSGHQEKDSLGLLSPRKLMCLAMEKTDRIPNPQF